MSVNAYPSDNPTDEAALNALTWATVKAVVAVILVALSIALSAWEAVKAVCVSEIEKDAALLLA